VDPSVDKPSVDKRPQRNPAGNALSQRQAAVDNGLLVERTTAKTKSNSIIPNSREPGRQNNVKYNTVPHVPKKEVSRTKLIFNRIHIYVCIVYKTYTTYYDEKYMHIRLLRAQSESLWRRPLLCFFCFFFCFFSCMYFAQRKYTHYK